MNRPHFRRRPRPTDPEPEYSRLDRLDGLPWSRNAVEWPDVLAAEAPGGDLAAMQAQVDETLARLATQAKVDAALAQEKIDFPLLTIAGLPAEAATGRTRYDAEWPSVIAAEVASAEQIARVGAAAGVSADEWSSLPPVFAPHSFVGGDLAAMAAPANWPPFTGWGEYDIGPWPGRLAVYPGLVSVREFDRATPGAEGRAMGDAIAEVVAAMRTAETDLRADGRAYESGRRSKTQAAAMRHARAALGDRTRGARDAAWILAGHVGVTP